MTITKELAAKVKELAEELRYDYGVVGIRVQEVPFELGELDHCSKVWDDGDETDEELDGVCITMDAYIDDCVSGDLQYYGDHVAVIAGNRFDYGEDYGEAVVKDPIVVEILA